MKIKKFIILVLSVIMICPFSRAVDTYADEDSFGLPEFPEISSDYVVLMDADSGEVLYSSNADSKCYPASTTKLLTGLLTVENCALTDVITFSETAVNSIEYGEANASISVGEQLTVEQALYCLILRSANEVAYGLAEYIGQTAASFASMMNSRAEELGAINTHFTNPSGLSDEFHYTTAYDMALIAKACFDNKTLMNIISYSDLYTIPPTNKSNFTRYYRHRYQMLSGGDFAYEYSMGGKTGYTDDAGSCLVSFAQKDDLRLICVIMKSTDTGRYEDTISLFDYYFNNYQKIYLDDYDTGLSTGNIDILNLVNKIDSTTDISVGFAENSYLLVPDSVTMSELTGIVTYADNPAYTGKEGGFACISYYYENINVGNATIMINDSAQNNGTGFNGVPAVSYETFRRDSGNIIYINIFYVLGGIFASLLIAFIIVLAVRKRRRRTGRHGSGKLRFK